MASPAPPLSLHLDQPTPSLFICVLLKLGLLDCNFSYISLSHGSST